MKRIEIVLLREDGDRALRFLGDRGCVQLAAGPAPQAGAPGPWDRLQEVRQTLGLADLPAGPLGSGPGPVPELSLAGPVSDHRVRREGWLLRTQENARIRALLEDFRGLDLTWARWEALNGLCLRVGLLPPGAEEPLRSDLGTSGLLRPLAAPGRFALLALTSDRSRWEPLLERHGFRVLPRPPAEVWGGPDLPLDRRLAALEDERDRLAAEGRLLDAERDRLAQAAGAELPGALAAAAVARTVEETLGGLPGTGRLLRIEGWIPVRDLGPAAEGLGQVTASRAAAAVRDPEGSEPVPTLLAGGRGTRGFERLLAQYGTPAYGDLDPTPFFTWSYLLFFGIMFGDVGQGLCLVLLGLLLGRGLPGLGGLRASAPAFVKAGLASTLMGFVYGSFFSSETVLEPLTRLVSGWWGTPVDHWVRLVPVGEPAQLFGFFGFTLALGAVLNSLGLVLNLANQIRRRRWDEAFLAKTGLAGALFFWYGLFFALRLLFGGRPEAWDLLGFGLPLGALLGGPVLHRLARGEEPFEGGPGLFLISLVLEALEASTFYLSHTLSFLRIGAFALSHGVLSLILFRLADLASGAGPAALLVLAVGNLLILGLEGLVVAIQVLRLEFNEFFAKFFFEPGTAFRPFRFIYQPVKGAQP